MRKLLKTLSNNEGFTLIELLAVIIILAVLMVFAGSNVISLMSDARKSSFRSEFLSLLDAAEIQAQSDLLYGKALQKKGDTQCYSDLSGFENNSNYEYYVLVTNTGDGILTYKGWMYSTSFAILDQDINLTTDNVQDLADVTPVTNCGQ